MAETSTKPYLLRAIYEWCGDNGYTPYLALKVDERTVVPMEHVENGEIVLNVSFTATQGLKMENEYIFFNARFSGTAREIVIPVDNVLAIYAKENGQGMAFEVTLPVPQADKPAPALAPVAPGLTSVPSTKLSTDRPSGPDDDKDPPKKGGRPTLTRIK